MKPAIMLTSPFLSQDAMASLSAQASVNGTTNRIPCHRLDGSYDATSESLVSAVARLQKAAQDSVAAYDSVILIISDRLADRNRIAIPSLLAMSAVHHHLIAHGLRIKAALISESGDACQPHHFATLVGYGGDAVHPWLALQTIASLTRNDTQRQNQHNYLKAADKALLKIMSKMGISTFQSYCGAQIFDSIGLESRMYRPVFSWHTSTDWRYRYRRHREGYPPTSC